jgi:hypothetical protein
VFRRAQEFHLKTASVLIPVYCQPNEEGDREKLGTRPLATREPM